jgi:hypothetical protein
MRKNFTPSEIYAINKYIHKTESKQGENQHTKTGSGQLVAQTHSTTAKTKRAIRITFFTSTPKT